ncbi:MAG TPA: amylo-alpha-1,6-glucosidase [Cyclobacteriaceae bacterium]|nr:amylo-alpha-1,6-glucosidase [Cyclobacteriaceae bacterium]
MTTVSNEKLQRYEVARSLEWLETNGLGGWASSTVAGAHTRRYHGLLVASLHPPVERKVMVSRLQETIITKPANLEEADRFELSTNQFPGTLHPQGFKYLDRFEHDMFPVFYFKAGNIELKKTIVAIRGENTTLVLYEVVSAPKTFTLELLPLYSGRDFHSLSHANDAINRQYVFSDHTLRVKNYVDLPEIFIHVPASSFTEEQNWHYNFEYPEEQDRGLDFREDLFSHGKFSVELKKGSKLGIILSTEDTSGRDAIRLFNKERKRREALVMDAGNDQMRRLILAADQFVVKRGSGLETIIAGYHWFSDWGRDTMISLPGICLATGRFDDAKKILKAFAESVSDGMLPNRFPDHDEAPEYNTIDATLWFFYAIYQYYQFTGDKRFVKSVLPVLKDIIEWHYKGTRYHIHVDDDGLLYGGREDVQLTWMDAKVGGWVVTPRKGKPVEINALWYNALRILEGFSNEIGKPADADLYAARAEKALQSFNQLFWNEKGQYLYDYVDGEYKNDDIRPNQIYAISLPFPLLEKSKSEKVFNVVENNLLTPRGLRSLSPSHKDYKPLYGGDVWSRDGSYHQGTVWSYLLGPFIDAMIRVKGESSLSSAKGLLNIFLTHLDEACVGSISEIFDADAPHTPRGCIAQAWGVGEILRVAATYDLLGSKKKLVEKPSAVHL